jgi:hypothetical protein
MTKVKPKLIQNIFEARYERGYRYLDRCGDAMVILEEALPAISNNSVWMPEEMQPKGARMKCPELDITLVFDTSRLCLDQNPADVECPFENISKYAFDTVVSKFDIRKITRLGNRQRYILPTDSVEKAEALSVKKAPSNNWPVPELNNMKPQRCEAETVFESADHSAGVRFSIGPAFRVEAPLKLDKRLTMVPHLLKEGQREALISQMKRQKQREKAPLAGLVIDIDYWWLNPEETSVEKFLESSNGQIKGLLKSFLE